MEKYVRNGKIDLLKFLFSIMVIVFHFNKHLYNYDFCQRGYIAVEFFFVTSGFLFAKSLAKIPCRQETLFQDSVGFMKKKFFSFFPYHLFFFIACFVFVIVQKHFSVGGSFVYLLQCIPDLLILQMGGISHMSPMRYEWYISAMLIVMFVLTPLIIRFRKAFLYYIAPILFVGILGLIYHEKNTLNLASDWNGFCYWGVLRAVSELSLGCLCYVIHERQVLKAVPKPILYLTEPALYLIIFLYGSKVLPDMNDFAILFIAAIAVTLSFDDRTSIPLFNNRFVYFLGKLSFPVYLSQLLVIETMKCLPFPDSAVTHTLIYIGTVLLVSLLCILITDNIQKLLKKIPFHKASTHR